MSNLPTFSTTVGTSSIGGYDVRIVSLASGYFRFVVWVGKSCWGEYRSRDEAVAAAALVMADGSSDAAIAAGRALDEDDYRSCGFGSAGEIQKFMDGLRYTKTNIDWENECLPLTHP